jgi:hypothetical protein
VQRHDALAQEVAHPHARHRPRRIAHHLHHLGVVEGARAVSAGREHVLQAQTLGIDEQVVEIVAGAAQTVRPDPRLERERIHGREHAIALPIASGGEPVVEGEPEAHLDQAARRFSIDRHEKGQRPHEVRREPAQPLALAQRLAHEPEVEQLEIPKAAVDELGGA